MKKQYKFSTLALALLAIGMIGSAQAEDQFVGGSSNTKNVVTGKSVGNGGPHKPGFAGIGVRTLYNLKIVDLQGVAKLSIPYGTSDGVSVYSLALPVVNLPGSHLGMGVFSFAKVGAGDVWFGEWSTNGSIGGFTDRTVYYVGDKAGTTMPTGGSATYAVKGINKHNTLGTNLMSGTFTADFGANTLSGSIANSDLKVTINANISGSGFNGTATAMSTNTSTPNGASGSSQGQFYGNQAAALAGMATFAGGSQYDTAFGGNKQP
ncbi:hypothetical protein EBB59_09800 [Lysobacter pythonis]|uniref:Uncharacterized protein n=1 Tax=Solilutibacter pythonis TaxID=2483112 RepID=A0A3M2HNY0_9GAMM|nr:Slam-dependent surface lipoprotein [Lysobacter pythonis]RMH90738.1 hypothetical protein EBB59_09800 [Lysobacter pythonis]